MSDVMLLGVLRMPMPDEPHPLTLAQFVSRARQAADRIEADEAELKKLLAWVESERQADEALMRQALGALAGVTTARCAGMDITPINDAYGAADAAIAALRARLEAR